MATYVTCTVCGEDVGKMGIAMHSKMHRREFKEKFGRPPRDYDEVRSKLHPERRAKGSATLDDYA